MSLYLFHTTCVSSDSDSINEMTSLSGLGHQQYSDLTYNQLKNLLGDGFWQNYADKAADFKQDPYIYSHQSFYQGAPCVYIRASAIEHVYLLQSDRLNSDGNTYSRNEFVEFSDAELAERRDLIDLLNEKSDDLEHSLVKVTDNIANATLRMLKSDNYPAAFARLAKQHHQTLTQITSAYAELTNPHHEQLRKYRILPASILQNSNHLQYHQLDAACCVMDILCMYGHQLGYPIPEPAPTLLLHNSATTMTFKPEPEAPSVAISTLRQGR